MEYNDLIYELLDDFGEVFIIEFLIGESFGNLNDLNKEVLVKIEVFFILINKFDVFGDENVEMDV